MRKYIVSMFVLVGLIFSVSVAHASATPKSQVDAIIEILETLGVSNTKIDLIVNILSDEVIDEDEVQLNGCEDNHKFNIITGVKCNSYHEPSIRMTPQREIKDDKGNILEVIPAMPIPENTCKGCVSA